MAIMGEKNIDIDFIVNNITLIKNKSFRIANVV